MKVSKERGRSGLSLILLGGLLLWLALPNLFAGRAAASASKPSRMTPKRAALDPQRKVNTADRKTQLLNQRKAAEAAAPPRTTPLSPPLNDTCAGAEVIPPAGPFPYLTLVTADITDATTTSDPPTPSCQTDLSRSIWYTFTPTASASYTIASCANVTATTVDDTVMAIYTSTGGCGGTLTELPTSPPFTLGCNDDNFCGDLSLQAAITTQLTASTQYFIVVWEFGSAAPTPGQTAVQLRVSQFVPPANDTCSAPVALALDTPINGSTVAASNDYQLSGAGCFTGIGQTASTATGGDVVYSFTAPLAGNYSFRVTGYATQRDLVLYVASTCPAGTPPITVSTCLAASNRNPGSSAEEVKCLALTASQQVFVFVDETFISQGSAFTIEVNRCVQETEGNDTPGTANAVTLPIVGLEGSINPGSDVDFFSLGTVAANSRIFAVVDGVAGNSTDFDLRVTTSTDTLEYDDGDNDEPFGFVAPNIEGTPTGSSAQLFLRVNQFSAQAAEPYRLYAVVQPPGSNTSCNNCSAITEVEPNNSTAQANASAGNYFYGTLTGPSPSADVDTYRFMADAGALVSIGLDCDPLRNNTPVKGQLELLDLGGIPLLTVNVSDAISCTAEPCADLSYPTCTHPSLTCYSPRSPGLALVYRIRTTGTYYARVSIGTTSTGPAGSGDYLLSIAGALPTAARFTSEDVNSVAKATSYNGGVSVQWQTGFEVDNLGFNIYREAADGKRVRVNSQIIAGSALMVGSTALGAGKSYSWFDNQPSSARTQYWIEAVSVSAESSWHGPIFASPATKKDIALLSKSATLGELSRASIPSGVTAPVERTASVAMVAGSGIAQASLAGQPAVKLSVSSEGIYRVTQPELLATGFDPKVDPRMIQVFADGQEQPINVTSKSGKFDASSAIEFYGIGVDSPSTDNHVYWVVAGSQPGKRMQQLAAPSNQLTPGSFLYTVETKERSLYFASLRNGEKENFFGAVVARDPVDQSLRVRHLDTALAEGGTLEVALQGVTSVAHRVDVQINGARAGTVIFNGQDEGVAKLSVSQSALKEGANTVRLIAQGGQSDISLVDYVRLTYWHSYVADDDQLKFTAPGKQVTVDGFSSPAIRVFDVTDPAGALEIVGTVRQSKSGYSVALSAPGARQRTLLAIAGDSAKRVASAAANQPSNWRQPGLGANLVIITRRDFFPALDALKKLRTSQGYEVALVDVQDVYDEFSYGNKSPQAIKDFLEYARNNWKIKPGFVLLAGDASVDPKNYLGFGDNDLVPAKLIDTAIMETVSDDWLADFNRDGLSEVAVGRLPVRTVGEATAMAAKIVRYDQTFRSSNALLVADADDKHDFQIASRELRALVPADVKTEEIYRGLLDPAAARKQLLDALNRGPRVVNYAGHGNANSWRSGLLTSDDARSLRNGESLSLFVTMTCLNGYFADAQADSLAESLMKAESGGAVAVWASSGMALPGEQSVMDLEMFRWLFDRGSSLTLGEAVLKAKATVPGSDALRTWILFGDPSMRIKTH